MRERPILFNGAMVRAILAGQKTQTRRAVKPDGAVDVVRFIGADNQPTGEFGWCSNPSLITRHIRCPFGQPGDRLWVRESFTDLRGTGIEHRPNIDGPIQRYAYSADTLPGSPGDYARKDYGIKWRPSIHMPREACRLVLEIIAVRVERLQAISEVDAVAEGLSQSESGSWLPGPCDHPEWAFHQLWAQVYGETAWEANPWVWVIEFNKINEVSNG
ncbi:hypothetical protein [Stenotrophomonas sp. BIO128-Bstrain]|uniref:hypothetical protein n=1 Tax=Stenotrophomonas sp. BIO128-Bstrain TaxID=3027225 RepID=UPI0024DE4739|nr:hypothetical protein [Stenotrophomonas sp. BIO128-Bstrain]WIA62265.1 hypothetical protein POS15_03300 [Stenotrophomonas sp. BIO128-Bstrain]